MSNKDLAPKDLLELIKGFIDTLILASGYQSSGRLAHWDSTNIKKAFMWALFLENSHRCIRCSDDYQDHVESIDAALSEIKSSPRFPQGLRHVSFMAFGQAKILLLKYLLHALPLRVSHLRAAATAITETDINGLQRTDDRPLDVYLENLVRDASSTALTWTACCMEGSTSASSETTQPREDESCSDCDFTKFAVQELGKRHLQVSCITAVETGLDVLSKITGKSNWNEVETTGHGDQLQKATTFVEENPIEPVIWDKWKSRSLSYLLNKRTARLASGSNLLFSAPKHQWTHVIEQLHISDDSDDDILEKLEILLLGRIVHRWNSLIKILVSNSYESITISKLYHEVQNLPFRRFQNLFSKEDLNPEENGVLEYSEKVLSNHFHRLWKLTPVLVAMAIPSRSLYFKLYMIELESQIRGDSSAIRCCSCAMDGKMHTECELAERIWCLYVFHVCGSWWAVLSTREWHSAQSNKGLTPFGTIKGCLISFNDVAFTRGASYSLSHVWVHQEDLQVLREQIINFSNMSNSKKIQILKWGRRRFTGSGNAVTLGKVQRRAPVSCCQASYVARQLVWRIKSLWKAALKWQRSSIQYSYDAQSYSKNFDDGSFNDHPSPLAPK